MPAFSRRWFRRAPPLPPPLPPAAIVAASAAALSSIWALCVHGRMRLCSVGIVPPSGRILPPSARHRGATIPVERGKDVRRSCKGEGSGGRACAHRAECLAAAPSCRPCNPPTYLGALGVAPAHPATSRISCAHSLPFHPPGQGGGVAVSACAPRCAPCAARASQPPRTLHRRVLRSRRTPRALRRAVREDPARAASRHRLRFSRRCSRRLIHGVRPPVDTGARLRPIGVGSRYRVRIRPASARCGRPR